jgi:hypothetical protein
MIWYVLVIAFFASVWMIAGTAGLGFPGNLVGVVIAIGGSILFASIMLGRQTPARSYGPAPDLRWYWAAVGFEVVAIIIAVWWLGRIDRPAYILPVISAIVGIHFFGLVPAFHTLRFFWIGLVMFLLPIFAILLLPSELRGQHGPVSVRSLVVGVGCALTLWLGALL